MKRAPANAETATVIAAAALAVTTLWANALFPDAEMLPGAVIGTVTAEAFQKDQRFAWDPPR